MHQKGCSPAPCELCEQTHASQSSSTPPEVPPSLSQAPSPWAAFLEERLGCSCVLFFCS